MLHGGCNRWHARVNTFGGVERALPNAGHDNTAGDSNTNTTTNASCQRHGSGRATLTTWSLGGTAEQGNRALNTHPKGGDHDTDRECRSAQERRPHHEHTRHHDQHREQHLRAMADRQTRTKERASCPCHRRKNQWNRGNENWPAETNLQTEWQQTISTREGNSRRTTE